MTELLALFTQAGKLLREATDEAMSRHGVRVGQHIVLSVLWEEDGLTPGEIARRLDVATPTIVNTATRMEEAGLLVRRPDPDDARLVRLYLTPHARSVRESVRDARTGLERRATATLDPAELAQLRSALEKIIARLRDGRTEGLSGSGRRRMSGVDVPGPGLGAGLDGVPGAAQRRGVGQVQVAERLDAHAVEDRGGRDVDPLGDLGVLVAEQLHAEQPSGGPVAGEQHRDAVAAGVV